MNRSIFIIISVLLAVCHSRNIFFEIENDQQYPQLITVSNVQHSLDLLNKQIDLSATVSIYEDIDDGTNVKVIVSPDFPYARFMNNIDVNLCTFCRRGIPQYEQSIEASGGQFLNQCPIQRGVYQIQNMRIDLKKFPMLWHA